MEEAGGSVGGFLNKRFSEGVQCRVFSGGKLENLGASRSNLRKVVREYNHQLIERYMVLGTWSTLSPICTTACESGCYMYFMCEKTEAQ